MESLPGRGNSNCKALGPGKDKGCLRNNVSSASVAGEPEGDTRQRHTPAALLAVLRTQALTCGGKPWKV